MSIQSLVAHPLFPQFGTGTNTNIEDLVSSLYPPRTKKYTVRFSAGIAKKFVEGWLILQ